MKFSYLTVLAFASIVVGQTSYRSGLDINKCIAANGLPTESGALNVIWDCISQDNERWIANTTTSNPSIRSFSNPTLCFDAGDNPAPGSAVMVRTCIAGFGSQQFTQTTFGNMIEFLASGLCVGVPSSITTNGNPLHLALCDANDRSQVWNSAPL